MSEQNFYSFNIVRYRTSQKWQVAVERSSENGQTNIASPLPPMRDGPPTWFYNRLCFIWLNYLDHYF